MWAVVILVVAGCGRIGFDPFGSAPIDAAIDGSENAPACLMNQAYATRAGLTNLYREVSALVTWADARAACMADGARLWVPNDTLEAMTLDGDWVGITDAANEGTWLTVTGTPAPYLPWEAGQPDGGTLENCVRNEDNEYEDRACTDLRDYACECE